MMRNDIAFLITEEKDQGPGGELINGKESAREKVFVEKISVRGNEFYLAEQANFKITLILAMSIYEYSGESIVEYGGKEYDVIRSYTPKKTPEEIQLSCQRRTNKKGVNRIGN